MIIQHIEIWCDQCHHWKPLAQGERSPAGKTDRQTAAVGLPMAKRSYTRQEVKELLAALERQVREAAKLAAEAEHEASKHSFAAYRAFREKVGEFQALVILIEGRLRNMVDSRSEDLKVEFERLDALMLHLLIKASMRFFFVLSANPILPLGAREIFMSELRSLHEAREKLRRPSFEGKHTVDLERDLETAELILEEIIDKAPSLLQFGR